MKERLQKLISAYGLCSRRAAEKLIDSGRVTVNGVCAQLGDSADPETDIICVDGNELRSPPEKVYIMLNKPRGYITTVSDDRGRKTVMSLVADCGARVFPVGRLDKDSEGLLLLTNDGEFANIAAHPSGNHKKVYHVSVSGQLSGAVERLSQPMELDGYKITPAGVRELKKTEGTALLEVTISEGRNRQVRRMCENCGLNVRRLVRVSEAGIDLGTLSLGKWRHLTTREILQVMSITNKNAGNSFG